MEDRKARVRTEPQRAKREGGVVSTVRALHILLVAIFFGILGSGLLLSFLAVWITHEEQLRGEGGSKNMVLNKRILPQPFAEGIGKHPTLKSLQTYRTIAE